jgi:hypothetical protein
MALGDKFGQSAVPNEEQRQEIQEETGFVQPGRGRPAAPICETPPSTEIFAHL